MLRTIILPRQARDKHTRKSLDEGSFCAHRREMMSLDQEQSDKDLKEVFNMVDDDDSVRNEGLLRLFFTTNDHFTKTGSGQAQGKLQTKTRFP
jgi:hypothetical protein